MLARPFSVLCALAVFGLGACVSSDPWPSLSLPSSTSGNTATYSNPKPIRVAQLIEGEPDGYVVVVALKGTSEVGRWSGPIDWFRDTPARITVQRSGQHWVWSMPDVKSMRVHAPNREKGGTLVHRWAAGLGADRVSIIVVDHPGEPNEDAGHEGLGVHGKGRGTGRSRPVHAAHTRGPDTDGGDSVDIGQGEPTTGQGETGIGQGMGRGEGEHVGNGTRDIGTKHGSEHGSKSPSWYANRRADVAKHGGRTPAEHGKDGGSASGEAHSTGHANGAGWLNWIDVPIKLQGAAAIIAIVLAADITGIADRLFQKVVRGMLRAKLKRQIINEAKNQAKKQAPDAKRALRAQAGTMSTKQMADAIKDAPEALEMAFYAELQQQARQNASIYRTIIDQTAESTDDVAKHANRLATENLRAWRQIQEIAGEQGRAMRAAARPPDAIAKQPYDPHKVRALVVDEHPGKVTSSTVPNPRHNNVQHRGTKPEGAKVPYDIRGFPIFDDVAVFDTRLTRSQWVGKRHATHQRAGTRKLREAIDTGQMSPSRFTSDQLDAIRRGKKKIPGYVWHHHQDTGRMQLIPVEFHAESAHVGGFRMWRGDTR